MLFDQPGLGKTLQVILPLRIYGTRHNIVVCPTPCFGVWRSEIQKWWPVASSYLIRGKASERAKDIQSWRSQCQNSTKPYFVICSPECFKSLASSIRGWQSMTFDEPHRYGLANRTSQIFMTVKEASSQSSAMLFFLTGTPMKKGVEQLWSYLNLIDPKQFRSFWNFMSEHVAQMQGEFGGREYLGIKDPTKLRSLLSQYGLRRLKKDVLPQLPPKQRQAIVVEMSSRLRKIYDEFNEELLVEDDEGGVLSAANRGGLRTRQRKLLLNPRIQDINEDSPHRDTVWEICQQRFDEGEKVYIFSPFVDEMLLNATELEQHFKLKCYVMHGRQKQEENQSNLDRFKNSKQSCVLFSTVQMGISWDIAEQCSTGIGWGLSDAPDDMKQSEDRLHRFLTKNPVNIYYPICQDSVEEKQMMILDEKTQQQSLILDRSN